MPISWPDFIWPLGGGGGGGGVGGGGGALNSPESCNLPKQGGQKGFSSEP